jgi:hypothetical protein
MEQEPDAEGEDDDGKDAGDQDDQSLYCYCRKRSYGEVRPLSFSFILYLYRLYRWWLATIQLALTSGSISTVSRSKARYQRAGTVKIVLQSSREEGVRWRSLARAGSHETNSVSYKVRQYRPYHIFVLEVVTV